MSMTYWRVSLESWSIKHHRITIGQGYVVRFHIYSLTFHSSFSCTQSQAALEMYGLDLTVNKETSISIRM